MIGQLVWASGSQMLPGLFGTVHKLCCAILNKCHCSGKLLHGFIPLGGKKEMRKHTSYTLVIFILIRKVLWISEVLLQFMFLKAKYILTKITELFLNF